MNLNPQPNMKAEQADLRRHIVELEKKVDKLVDTLAFVRGQPIIQAYVGKRLELNENLIAVDICKKLKPFAVGEACVDLVTVIELANLIRAGGITNGIYTVE